MSDDDSRSARQMGRLFAMAQVGLEMVGALGIGLAIDYFVGTSPWGVIVGTLLGFVGGMFHLITLAQEQAKDTKQPPREDPKA